MRVTLHTNQCQGHNRCTLLAPDVFDSDDEGFAVLLVHGDLPTDYEEQAQLAADNCPEYAIELTK